LETPDPIRENDTFAQTCSVGTSSRLNGLRHELGLQMAALTALGAGVNPVYIGCELPIDALVAAVARTQATTVAPRFISTPTPQATGAIATIRAVLPPKVHCWIGGAASAVVELADGAERIADLDDLENRAMLLAVGQEGSG
jgi:hypothetical protein